MKKIRIAISGAGNRARTLLRNLKTESCNNIEVVAVYDPDHAVAKEAANGDFAAPGAKICASWDEALACECDWAYVVSPNFMHKEQILAAFSAGKNVFSEKPLATSIEDCQAIYQAWQKSGKLFATGFVLRYSLIYRKAKELLQSGSFGKLLSIEGNENIYPQHGGYIASNWRRHRAEAGPHILEKCCHDLDLIEWLSDALPLQIAAFHDRDFFTSGNRFLEEKYGKDSFIWWRDPHRVETPFNDDCDLMDKLVSIARFSNGVLVSFNYVMASAIAERKIVLHCSEGTIRIDLYRSEIEWKHLGDDAVTTLNFSGCDGHGGGDPIIAQETFASMTQGIPPKCGGAEGLRSAVYALAIDRAAREGKFVDLTAVWQTLGVTK